MRAIYEALVGWLPLVVQYVILGLIAFLVIRLVLKIVQIVLDAIPFI